MPIETLGRFRSLFAYDAWANREALASLCEAGSPPPRAVQIMGHILGAEFVWLERLHGQKSSTPVWPELSLDDCAAKVAELIERWKNYLNSQAPDGLQQLVSYTNSKGESWSNRSEDILTHVLMHSAYHRGQIATALGGAGRKAAYTDFIHWERSFRAE
jgi:uncharacterized damage-inducible protein DinB